MARSKRSTAKREKWRQIIESQDASGLSVRAFCRQEGIHETRFYSWRRTLRDESAAGQVAAVDAFVPASISERPAAPPCEPIVIELGTGPTLRLPAATTATWVAELIIALNSRGSE